MSADETPPGDPLAIFDDLGPLRETIRGLVAMWQQEGFTEAQSRDLAVAQTVQALRGATG